MERLKAVIHLNIRFSETDAMGVVWHGNYLKFFEDAREFFGEKYQMSYLNIYHQGFFTPLVKTEVNHKRTLDFGDKVRVEIELEFCKAAKIIHHYKVYNDITNAICATGSTTQVFMDAKTREMVLYIPSFYAEWLSKYQN